MFVPAFRDVLVGDGNGVVNQETQDHRRLAIEDQKRLRARIEITIESASIVSDFSSWHDVEDVRTYSNAFFTIATFFPDRDPDDLGLQLRTSYRLRSGASVTQQCIDEAAKLDAELRSMGLFELCDEAHFFYSAVGALDDSAC
jgi:hypothetical protein